MVDVGAKRATERRARAEGVFAASPAVIDALLADDLPKKDALATARIAGIQAAKRTAELIPLCHPLALDHVQIEFDRAGDSSLLVRCSVGLSGRTGAEMEAMTGVSVALLTLYDMAKAADKGIALGPVRLLSKSGGKSGDWLRDEA